MNYNISIVDSHNIYRKGLIGILVDFKGIDNIYEFESGINFVEFIEDE